MSSNLKKPLRFVDLFAGLGGFHQALSRLGHECVFASEIDGLLRDLYKKNFELKPHGDIRECWRSVPEHDVLCAGFPCQPFSKAGGQLGFDCPTSGDMFEYMLRILDLRCPPYVLLENVPNILRHNNGATWDRIRTELGSRDYIVRHKVISPEMYGVPQKRKRAIIVAWKSTDTEATFPWPEKTSDHDVHIDKVLDTFPNDAKKLTKNANQYLDVWQEFLDRLPEEERLPSFPIWGMEFGANYPLTGTVPAKRSGQEMWRYHGSLGMSLKGLTPAERLAALPPYARQAEGYFPAWKVSFIKSNRAFYSRHRNRLEDWLPKIAEFAPSFQKFEWNWKEGPRRIDETIIQFRASGIRAKRPFTAPSLVALTTSQVPVVSWERRFMTIRECARLQSMGDLPFLPEAQTRGFKALGNAVNVEVIERVATALLSMPTTKSSDAERIIVRTPNCETA